MLRIITSTAAKEAAKYYDRALATSDYSVVCGRAGFELPMCVPFLTNVAFHNDKGPHHVGKT
jgi:hypothetical protein